MRVWIILVLASALLAQETPTFRTESRLVEVQVVVTGRGDTPALGLTEGDFRILENGKPQKVAFFSAPSQTPPTLPEPLPAGLFTNRPEYSAGAPAGVTAIVLDLLNTLPQDQFFARSQLARFLRNLAGDEVVAVYVMTDRIRVVHDYTDDRRSLQKLVGALRNEWPAGGLEREQQFQAEARLLAQLVGQEEIAEMGGTFASRDYERMRTEQRTESTMTLLEVLAQHLAGVPGRKSLVWIGAGLPMATVSISPAVDAGRSIIYQNNNAVNFKRALQMLADANVAVYPVDARGLRTDTVFPTQQPDFTRRTAARGGPAPIVWQTQPTQETFTAMQVFAESTGGRATYNTNDLESGLRRASDDLKASYTLAYYTSLADDARERKLEVKVTRPNVNVLARNRVPASRRDGLSDARSLLESPLPATGVLLNGRVTRSGENVRVTLQIEPGSLLLSRNGGRTEGLVEVYLAQIKPSGERTVSDSRMELRLSDAQLQKIAAEGLIYERLLPVEPDVERLRILVRDPRSGAAGSFDAPLRVVPAEQ